MDGAGTDVRDASADGTDDAARQPRRTVATLDKLRARQIKT